MHSYCDTQDKQREAKFCAAHIIDSFSLKNLKQQQIAKLSNPGHNSHQKSEVQLNLWDFLSIRFSGRLVTAFIFGFIKVRHNKDRSSDLVLKHYNEIKINFFMT